MNDKKIAVTLYTGEYTRGFETALASTDAWFRSYDSETFRAGYQAAASKKKWTPEEEDAAWATYQGELLKWDGLVSSFQTDLATTADLVIVWGSEEALFDAAWQFASTLTSDVPTIGGDDTVYDYFPDAMEALYQLCRCIGSDAAKQLYESTVLFAWEALYSKIDEYTDPTDVFVSWK